MKFNKSDWLREKEECSYLACPRQAKSMHGKKKLMILYDLNFAFQMIVILILVKNVKYKVDMIITIRLLLTSSERRPKKFS